MTQPSVADLEKISANDQLNKKLAYEILFWKNYVCMAQQAYTEATGRDLCSHSFKDSINFNAKIKNQAEFLAILYNDQGE